MRCPILEDKLAATNGVSGKNSSFQRVVETLSRNHISVSTFYEGE